jgi:hypothetical protein
MPSLLEFPHTEYVKDSLKLWDEEKHLTTFPYTYLTIRELFVSNAYY